MNAPAAEPVAQAIGQPNLSADLGSNLDDAASPLPPMTPPGALPSVEEQLAALTKQMSALLALQSGMMTLAAGNIVKVSDDTLQAQAAAVELPQTPANVPRVRILIEDNDAIPPGGQFLQANGVPFLLQSGMEMDAPVSVLDVLDHAITSVPVTDENKNIIGYRDRLRFPYRVVRHQEH